MIVKEIKTKKILSESKIYPYTINPYVGCQHSCSYCYARFITAFKKTPDFKSGDELNADMSSSDAMEILAGNNWPFTIQTKSPLVVRDIDIFKKGKDVEIGFSIATADDKIRKIFEPSAPPINLRIKALEKLHQAGLKTFVMIAPVLPGAEKLPKILAGKVDHVIIDRMNYHYADWVYRKYGLEDKKTDEYFSKMGKLLSSSFAKLKVRLIY